MAEKVYQQQVNMSALPQVRQNLRYTPAQGLEALGQGVQRAGAGYGALVQKVHAEQANARFNELAKQVLDEKRRLSWDTQDGFMEKQGTNAVAALQTYNENFNKFVEKLQEKTANDPELQKRFNTFVMQQQASFADKTHIHAAQQSLVASREAFKGHMDAVLNEMSDTAKGPDTGVDVVTGSNTTVNHHTFGQLLEQGYQVIEEQGKHEGLPPEAVAQQKRAFVTQANITVLSSLLQNGKAMEAKGRLQALKDSNIDLDNRMLANSGIEAKITDAVRSSDANAQVAAFWQDSSKKDKNNPTGEPQPDVARAAFETWAEKNVNQPLLVDATRQKLQEQISQYHSDLRVADAPRLGEIRSMIANENMSERAIRASAAYQGLHREARGAADEMLRNRREYYRRKREGKGAQHQEQVLKDYLARYRNMPLSGHPGHDQISVDIRTDPMFSSIPTERIFNEVGAAQRRAIQEYKDRGGSALQAFKLQTSKFINQLMAHEGHWYSPGTWFDSAPSMSEGDSQDFRGYAEELYYQFKDAHDGRAPNRLETHNMLLDAIKGNQWQTDLSADASATPPPSVTPFQKPTVPPTPDQYYDLPLAPLPPANPQPTSVTSPAQAAAAVQAAAPASGPTEPPPPDGQTGPKIGEMVRLVDARDPKNPHSIERPWSEAVAKVVNSTPGIRVERLTP